MNEVNYLEQLELMGEMLIDTYDSFIKYAETYELTNSQEFLETMDEMNQLSVKY